MERDELSPMATVKEKGVARVDFILPGYKVKGVAHGTVRVQLYIDGESVPPCVDIAIYVTTEKTTYKTTLGYNARTLGLEERDRIDYKEGEQGVLDV